MLTVGPVSSAAASSSSSSLSSSSENALYSLAGDWAGSAFSGTEVVTAASSAPTLLGTSFRVEENHLENMPALGEECAEEEEEEDSLLFGWLSTMGPVPFPFEAPSSTFFCGLRTAKCGS